MDILSLATRSTGTNRGPSSRPEAQLSRRPSRAELVTQVDDFLRHNINEPVTVGDLSRMAGVSERTLRSAFHDVLGVSPKQWALRQRLAAARGALSAASPRPTTRPGGAPADRFFQTG